MKLDKSGIFRKFREELIQKYGPEKAYAIWSEANTLLQEYEDSEPDADKTCKQFVFPAVALYRAIDHHAPGDALEETRKYGTLFGKKVRNIFRRITALPGVPSLMWKNMDKLAKKMSDGYGTQNVTVSREQCALDVISCPICDKAKSLGAPDAAQMICCMDKEYMTGIRGMDYKRTKSLAEGDDCCDYRMRRIRE